MPSHGKYSDELRERAVRMVLEPGHEYGSKWEAICSVAEKPGPSTNQTWPRPPPRAQRRRLTRRAHQHAGTKLQLDADQIRAYRRHGCTYRSKKPSRLSAKTWPGGLRTFGDPLTLPPHTHQSKPTPPPSSPPMTLYSPTVLNSRGA